MKNFHGKDFRIGFLIICFCIGTLLLTGNDAFAFFAKDKIKANPARLNGRHLSGVELEELEIRNTVIKGLVMVNVRAIKTKASNVTFENCTFKGVDMRYSHFENVAFKRCRFEASGDPDQPDNVTSFDYSTMKDVLFEQSVIHDGWFVGLEGQGGYIYLDRITDAYGRGGAKGSGWGPLFTGKNIHFRVKDSRIRGALRSSGEEGSIWARDSRFVTGHLSTHQSVFVEHCTLDPALVEGKKLLVIRDSLVANAKVVPEDKGYLVNNTYPAPADGTRFVWYAHDSRRTYRGCAVKPTPEARTVVIHADPAPACLSFWNGVNFVSNINLLLPRISQIDELETSFTELNLKNVTLLGGFIGGLNLLGGQWENVRIEPLVYVKNTRINNVKVHKLSFPKGDPWNRKGPLEFNYTESSTPFKWPEFAIPEPKDLGLEWWPATPGYNSAKGR